MCNVSFYFFSNVSFDIFHFVIIEMRKWFFLIFGNRYTKTCDFITNNWCKMLKHFLESPALFFFSRKNNFRTDLFISKTEIFYLTHERVNEKVLSNVCFEHKKKKEDGTRMVLAKTKKKTGLHTNKKKKVKDENMEKTSKVSRFRKENKKERKSKEKKRKRIKNL